MNTMKKILFKVFCAMSKDSYSYIYECFGIDNADQFIRKRQDNANKLDDLREVWSDRSIDVMLLTETTRIQ